MKNKFLEDLITSKQLAYYEYNNVSDVGLVGEKSKCRNTERLTLVFPNGRKLVLDTICSGSAENTVFCISGEN